MNKPTFRYLGASFIVLVIALSAPAYVLMDAKWSTNSIYFYVNPANLDGLPAAEVIADLQSGASAWQNQSNTSFRYVYGGTTTASSVGTDGKFNVMFRNQSNGSAIASTYTWKLSGRITEVDIVYWDAGFRFFTGSSGCSGGFYIQDIAAHEFGHGLGLLHSPVSTATMYYGAQPCDKGIRDLDPDDVAGVESLYPPSTQAPTLPAAPSSLIAQVNPSAPSSSIILSWTDNSSNESGFRIERSTDGSTFTEVGATLVDIRSIMDSGLNPDTTYWYRVRAYNSAGSSSYANLTNAHTEVVSVPPTTTTTLPPSGVTLSARGYKVKGEKKVDLNWSGTTTSIVDIYRNDIYIGITANDGVETDSISAKGGGTFRYRICDNGGRPCSNTVEVTF
jgi:hypothetical protein